MTFGLILYKSEHRQCLLQSDWWLVNGNYTNLPDLFEAFLIVLVAFSVVCRLILCRLSSTLFKNTSTVLLSYLISWTHLLSDIATTDLDFLTVFGLIGAFLGLAGVFLWLAKAFLGLPWPCPSYGVICPLAPGFPDQKFQRGCSFSDFDIIPSFMCSCASLKSYTSYPPARSNIAGLHALDIQLNWRRTSTHLPSLGCLFVDQCWPCPTMSPF